MRNELLDDEFSNSEGKSTAPSWKNWLITSLLWIGLLFNLIAQIEKFKLLYAEKGLPELEKIASSEKFVAEAKEAARLLLAKNS